ncbi:hypothetical protein EV384_2980 [Micromonospora kangleipakensis]|uniref:Uncharacterized protein n=1 Tax=Micromonospora kangleipakensis TaxID=1077942 RepID=A0A4Q8B9T5_9ACTN|nr:hypothetical protein [Micromonospora kangleipakensis]RZU74510.1 hypothetical protein EV384_2980 [Micromonospora kangleipakensis]
MNAHRMDQETVERLLVGPVADPQNGPEALVRLLTAVRAAPRPHELTGERAAMEAFRTARAGAVPAPAARPERRILAGLLNAKVALAALLAAAATGGVALAAATGNLPGSLGGADDSTTAPSASAGGHPTPTSGPGVSPTPDVGASARPTGSPALVGLCTAYQAEANGNRYRALESPRFAELVSAAGGREKVPGYCDGVLDPGNNQGGRTTGPGGRPGGEPTGRVTGRPDHAPSTPDTPEDPAGRPTGPTSH